MMAEAGKTEETERHGSYFHRFEFSMALQRPQSLCGWSRKWQSVAVIVGKDVTLADGRRC